MKHQKAFQSLYNINDQTNAYVVEVSLDDYAELFNGWDASPLRRKDLEPELLDYLEQAGYEISLKKKIEICFYLPIHQKDDDKEAKSLTGIKNNFRVHLFFIEKKLRKHYRQVITYITMSMLFITGAYTLRNVFESPLLFAILIEGLFIGGWFLLWEAFSTFMFDAHEERIRKKVFIRFLNSDVYFKDKS